MSSMLPAETLGPAASLTKRVIRASARQFGPHVALFRDKRPILSRRLDSLSGFHDLNRALKCAIQSLAFAQNTPVCIKITGTFP
jgi:hypothetical protein